MPNTALGVKVYQTVKVYQEPRDVAESSAATVATSLERRIVSRPAVTPERSTVRSRDIDVESEERRRPRVVAL